MSNERLVAFLLARIAEDEDEARHWPDEGRWGRAPDGGMWMDVTGRPIYAPGARVLAECEAKRLIMRGHESVYIGDEYVGEPFILRALALPYVDHSDYEEAWRP